MIKSYKLLKIIFVIKYLTDSLVKKIVKISIWQWSEEDRLTKISSMFAGMQGEGGRTCSHGFRKQIFALNRATLLARRKCI